MRYPKTRENDNLLIAHYIQQEYHTQNIFDVAVITKKNVYETVRRTRQKIQEENPLLRPTETVSKARKRKEADVREEVRGL